MSDKRLGLVGAGAVGPAVAARLVHSGWRLGVVASRRIESAREAVALAGEGLPSTRNSDAAEGADLLVIAVPDRAVAEVAREIAREARISSRTLAIHLSGALSSEVLAPLRDAGASVGSLHPLQTFADARSALLRLPSSFLFYEGDEPSRIREVAADLGGRPVEMRSGGKVLYHAGAAVACNLVVALVDLGVSLLEEAGIEREEALSALLPLIRGTVANLEETGLPGALTGPVSRGDVETVRAHLTAIARTRPDLLPAYREASRHAIRIAREKGSLTEGDAAALADLLTRKQS